MPDRDLTVYRSFHPDVVKHWQAGEAAVIAWRGDVKALLAELGMDHRTVWTHDLTGEIDGLDYDDRDVPDGWRVDARSGRLVPRRSTKPGKAIAAKLDALRMPDPRVSLPGMPSTCLVGDGLLTCGLQLMKGALYATWSRPIPEQRVDLMTWQPLKLSEYYAVLELEDADDA